MSSSLLPMQPSSDSVNPTDLFIDVGQWYVCVSEDEGEEFGCVVKVGSNFVEIDGPVIWRRRLSFEVFSESWIRCSAPDAYIEERVRRHREEVRSLVSEVGALCAQAGISPDLSLDSGSSELALTVGSGTRDWSVYGAQLEVLKKETLPELYEKIKKAHEKLATWMQATLIPLKAQLDEMQGASTAIQQRIFTVELYAGLVEKVVQIKEGSPASCDEKVSLFQRRHYMDEECLAAYDAGGMEFADISDFDAWLVSPMNLNRLLPFPRSIVAMRVRRKDKDRRFGSTSEFISFVFSGKEKLDKATFLYIRNGEQVFRLTTSLEFDEELFPDASSSLLLGDQEGLWAPNNISSERDIWDQRRYLDLQDRHAKYEVSYAKYVEELDRWEALTEEEKNTTDRPWHSSSRPHPALESLQPLDPSHLYYDDAMRMIRKEASKHNQVAVVLQGLLDRSPVLQPHPPWKLWTAEGFESAVNLVFDSSKALVSGDELPDFESYRAQLNKSLRVGSIIYGQAEVWARRQAEKERDRTKYDGQYRFQGEKFRPYGNDGPDRFARVTSTLKNGKVTCQWFRTYERVNSRYRADRPILTEDTFSPSEILNVSAYTAGDYLMFYRDPRLRQRYLEWAPFLLAAEDWAHGKAPLPWQDLVPDKMENDDD